MFICDKCGLCCQNLDKNEGYSDLDIGDGCCIHYDRESHLCSIYDSRPLKCNIDKSYDMFFSKIMTREEYYQLNYEACKKLKDNK